MNVFCMSCFKDLSDTPGVDACTCGSKNFYYGETLVRTDEGLSCSCGCNEIEMIAHINMSPKFIRTNKCKNCGAKISSETYYDMYGTED